MVFVISFTNSHYDKVIITVWHHSATEGT